MLSPFSSFSRARTLLQRAGNGTSALAGAGEAGVTDSDPLAAALQRITDLPDVEVVAMHREPARSAAFGTWPDHLDDRLLAALHGAAFARPYRHQEIALSALARGEHVVLCTATASGKSLCYQVPILDAVLRDPASRALMLFPTKALGRDQVESVRKLAHGLEISSFGVGVYDGDTPPDQRRAARVRAHAVATNPDMLHRGVLPHHHRWARFLAGLRYVVLDELHTYRGLFGAHVANVLRRLWRLCAHYGSSPQVIACSATIANPGELARALTGRAFIVIDHSHAPTAEKTFMVLNPKVVDPLTGVRRDYLKVTRAVTTQLRQAGVQTLTFCRTRKAVELLTRYMQDDERAEAEAGRGQGSADPSAIRGYRGGYLPQRRREVEQALREGKARVVATTNALELGIDIGGVDAVVLSGYPGTRAATVQRSGRAGRRGRPSATILCLSSAPLDQFIAADASFLTGRPPEHARVDPDNPEVVLPHLRCAAFELAFHFGSEATAGVATTDNARGASDVALGLPPTELRQGLDWLVEHGGLHREQDEDGAHYLPVQAGSPAEHVDLRGSLEENFTVVHEGTGDILAEVDFEDAPLYLHPGAIYPIEGQTHEVRRLDWDARKAFVRPVSADYYTEAISNLRVRMLDQDPETSGVGRSPEGQDASSVRSGHGFCHVVRTVPGFKKIRFGTHENIGFGPIRLPDLELHTTAAFWPFPARQAERIADPVRRCAAALAAAHALHHVAAMVLMCDTGDLGHVVVAGHPGSFGEVLGSGRRASAQAMLAAGAMPYIVLYDRHPGGAGLSSTAHALGAALLSRVAAMVRGCGCEHGCPTCMGPHVEPPREGPLAQARAIESATAAVSSDELVVARGDVVDLLEALVALEQRPGLGTGSEEGAWG